MSANGSVMSTEGVSRRTVVFLRFNDKKTGLPDHSRSPANLTHQFAPPRVFRVNQSQREQIERTA